MKISLKEKLKTNKGITLIALVITIIVLLILAGVTIATLTGENGILTKAQNAKTQNAKASIKEQIELAVLTSRMGGNLDAQIDEETLEDELINTCKITDITKTTTEGESTTLPWTVKKDGYVFTISEAGEVEEKAGIAITTGDIEILSGSIEGKTLTAELLGETGTITWSSEGNITLSPTTGGTTTVTLNNAEAGDTATVTATWNEENQTDSINVKVVAQAEELTIGALTVEEGKTVAIGKIEVTPENAEKIEITGYSSGDTSKATVNEKGEIKGVKEGRATITVTAKGKLSNATVTGTCEVTVEKIDHSEVVVPTITATGVFANNSNIAEVREGDIPIPKGYKYIKGDKIGGAVITDAASGQEGVGSEFVWIPVSKIKDMAQCDQADGTSSTCDIKTDENDGHLYCSTHNNTNIVGKLYAKSTGNNFGTENTSYNANSGLREPAIVTGDNSGTGSSYDAANYSNAGFAATDTMSGSAVMLAGLQSEYKKMATSVKKYGGFYVGRYETSLNNATETDPGDSDSTSVQSKVGVMSANASLNKTNMWYGLYKMSKTYAPEKNSDGSDNTSKSVVSSMIWGSQYDAMMNWMKGNGITVTSTTPSDLSIGTTSRNTTRVTGGANEGESVSKDKLSNIYDLLGNSYEWTLEAYDTDRRVFRGGSYDYGGYSPSHRASYSPTINYDYNGSRLTLYVK